MTEEVHEPRGRRVPWPLVAILALTMGLGTVVAYFAARPEASSSSPVEARPGPNDLVIVPGQRVDFVTLGLDVAEVEKRWGKALIRPTPEGMVYQFEAQAVSLMVQQDRVESVLVKNPALKTRGGTGVNSDVDAVVRELGKAYEYEKQSQTSYGMRYWDKGIHFVVEKTEVKSIQVTDPLYDHSPGAP